MFLALLVASATVVRAPEFTLFEPNTLAHGVSKNGRFVCGSYWDGKSWVLARWDGEVRTSISATKLAEDGEKGVSVSDRGDVAAVVTTKVKSNGYEEYRGFIWILGKSPVAVQRFPGTDQSWPRAISGDGSFFVGGVYTDKLNLATRWARNGSVSKMPQIPKEPLNGEALNISGDGKVIVGHLQVGKNSRAVVWRSGKAVVLPDLIKAKQISMVWACNRDGSVLSGFANDGKRMVPVIWPKSGGIKKLGEMPKEYPSGMARGMSDDGKVVVGLWGLSDEGFVWTESEGVMTLESFFKKKGLGSQIAGLQFRCALGVSGDGRTIVGMCKDSEGHSRGFKARV